MIKIVLPFIVFFVIVSCQSTTKKHSKSNGQAQGKVKKKEMTPFKNTDNALRDFDKRNISKTRTTAEGITIKWFQETFKKNPNLKAGEVYLINYRVSMPDGKIFDGNNRLGLPFIPFMVGYNMQFSGWDIAMKQLKVGDFAKIEIPSELAYGTKGLSNIVPANTPIWVYVKVVAKVSPGTNQGGVKSWTFDKGESTSFDGLENKEIIYHCIASSKSHTNVLNSYTRHLPFRYAVGQKNVVPGLRKVLKNAKKGQKIFVLLSPEQAYGSSGFGDLVGPNESIFYNLTIEDIKEL